MIVLGLGSNIGDRVAYLSEAIKELGETTLAAISMSSIYESDALLSPNSPKEWNKPFLNMVIAGETHLSPNYLLTQIKMIERKIGKRERGLWAPREIDIDILAYGDVVIQTEDFTVPHKELSNRSFALLPFAEVLPNWRYPAEGENYGKTAFELSNNIPATCKKTELSINSASIGRLVA